MQHDCSNGFDSLIVLSLQPSAVAGSYRQQPIWFDKVVLQRMRFSARFEDIVDKEHTLCSRTKTRGIYEIICRKRSVHTGFFECANRCIRFHGYFRLSTCDLLGRNQFLQDFIKWLKLINSAPLRRNSVSTFVLFGRNSVIVHHLIWDFSHLCCSVAHFVLFWYLLRRY